METKIFIVLFVASICMHSACGAVATKTASSIAAMQQDKAAKYNF